MKWERRLENEGQAHKKTGENKIGLLVGEIETLQRGKVILGRNERQPVMVRLAVR